MKPYDLACVVRACRLISEHAARAREHAQAANVHVQRAAEMVRQ
jgi:hypothetical protein